jgi:hypothetical protein
MGVSEGATNPSWLRWPVCAGVWEFCRMGVVLRCTADWHLAVQYVHLEKKVFV